MKRSIRYLLITRLLFIAGIIVGTGVVVVFLHFHPIDFSVDEANPAPTTQPLIDPHDLIEPQELTPTEAMQWLTHDCKIPARWDQTRIPGSAVVRNDLDRTISQVDLTTAYDQSKAGKVWILALCGRPVL